MIVEIDFEEILASVPLSLVTYAHTDCPVQKREVSLNLQLHNQSIHAHTEFALIWSKFSHSISVTVMAATKTADPTKTMIFHQEIRHFGSSRVAHA